VPGRAVGAGLEVGLGCGIVGGAVDEVDFWVALWCTAGLMDVAWAVVFGKVKSFLDGKAGKVLIAES